MIVVFNALMIFHEGVFGFRAMGNQAVIAAQKSLMASTSLCMML